IYPLPLQLHLMGVEVAIQGIRVRFGELTAFPVEFTRIVHALACSIGPALHVVESPLEGFPLFRDLGVDDRRFTVSVIDIDTKRNEP
ncbi:MAG TPA: hypothetical protein VIW48_07480, partial [Nitrospiraceae bacterium]